MQETSPIYPSENLPVHQNGQLTENQLSEIAQLYAKKIGGISNEILFPLAIRENFRSHDLSGIKINPPRAFREVALPSLYFKNILIRPPFPSERKKIWKKLDPLPLLVHLGKHNFFSCMKNEGYQINMNRIERVFVAGGGKKGKKIRGMINFYIDYFNFKQPPICEIVSLKVQENSNNLGIGTLLLSQAVFMGLQYGCESVSLTSSKKGIPLYLKGGFEPDFSISDKEQKIQRKWEHLDFNERINFCKEKKLFIFQFDLNEENINNLRIRLREVLNLPLQEKMKVEY